MNCDIAQSLLLDARPGAELEMHLASCANCRAFAHALLVFKKPVAPPPLPQAQHEKILSQSNAILRGHFAAKTTPRPIASPFNHFVFAAALLFYFSGWGLVLSWFARENVWMIFTAIFILQNLIAVCFAPLLFTRAPRVRHLKPASFILGAIRT